MAKDTIFFCKECGYESYKWMGQCPVCKEWNTFVEAPNMKSKSKSKAPNKSTLVVEKSKALKLDDIKYDTSYRMDTGLNELNRVLGGGLVLGSLVLLGGDPGIGKSTLLLQICDSLAKEGNILYISGEESAPQIKMRANRIGTKSKELSILSENNLDNIEEVITEVEPKIIIVDSVQTLYRPSVESTAGSISQVKEVTTAFTYIAKKTNAAVFLIGHVTKDGALAGPRVLEHLVDTVLYFEGDRYESYRILRAVKNRFGSTNEIGVFEMRSEGFAEVTNPSGLFISEDNKNSVGCGITCILEGTRPVLIELQALASVSSFGNPRRMSNGFDYNRMTLLMAILEKKAEYNFSKYDMYLNVVGGLKIEERASDLAVAVIMASTLTNVPLKNNLAIIGELSLTGEIRSVSNIDKRISECEKMGFDKIIIPKQNLKTLNNNYEIKIIPVENVNEALYEALDNSQS